MSTCKACSDSRSPSVEKQIWLGKLTVAEASKYFEMTYEDYWVHLKDHVVEKPAEKIDTNDPSTVLRHLAKRLYQRVDTILNVPPNLPLEKNVATQARLLKDIAMDIARIEHQLESAPQVQIQNFIIQQTELTTFLLSNLCLECKKKVQEHLACVPK